MMQRSKFLVGAVGGAALVAVVGGGVTYRLSNPETTSSLDAQATVQVDGHKAISGKIIAGRTQSAYHPLPWVGEKVSGVTCPTGLEAVKGATITCTGKKQGGGTVDIPVSVVKATDNSVTWKFER